MEAHSVVGAIHRSAAAPGLELAASNPIQIESKGEMQTFLLMPTNSKIYSVQGIEK